MGETSGAVVRRIIDANLYMVLATADAAGQPWASPVYFANAGYAEFFWVSSPDATHSRNIAVRPQIGIVVFDSQVPISTGQAVYMTAVAEQPTGAELERGIDVFSRRSLADGGDGWTLAQSRVGAAVLLGHQPRHDPPGRTRAGPSARRQLPEPPAPVPNSWAASAC